MRFAWWKQHREDIVRGFFCASLFIFIGFLIQWLVPNASSFVYKSKIIYWGLIAACSLAFWRWSRAYVAGFLFYEVVFLSAALLPLWMGQRLQRQELAAAYVMGAALFFFGTDLLYVFRRIPQSSLRRLADGVVYLCMALALVPPLLIWGYYMVSGHILSATIVLTLFQTNGSETWAYLQSQNLFRWAGAGILFLAILTGLTRLLCHLETPVCSVSKKVACLLVLLTVGYGSHTILKATDYRPVRIADETKEVLQQYKEYGEARAVREARLQQLQGLQLVSDGGLFVLVIGESETRDHMQAYGYERDTTPWLSKVAEQPEAILFSHAYSNHTHTVPVLTYALSEKNQYNDTPLQDACSLVEVAKAAGYDTYWISNQRKYGAWDTPIAEIASTAAHQTWLNERTGTQDMQTDYFDEALTKALPEHGSSANTLVVVHLMGCHGTYRDRYPAVWKQYSGQEKRIDTYDDAVRYNDYVLGRLYERLKEQPEFKGFIYFSDHGEDVEHGYAHEATKYTPVMTHIPLCMLFSPAFQAERPQTIDALKNHSDSYWTNDLIYNVMTDILGIESAPGTDADLDLASPQYSMSQGSLRTLHGKQMLE